MPNMSSSIVTPGGITSVTRSYFQSLGSLTFFVVGFLDGTYTLGKFIRFDVFALGVSSCTGVDVCLVRDFFIWDVDASTFGGAMDFYNSYLSASHSALCSL
jgi:hypothetical protein